MIVGGAHSLVTPSHIGSGEAERSARGRIGQRPRRRVWPMISYSYLIRITRPEGAYQGTLVLTPSPTPTTTSTDSTNSFHFLKKGKIFKYHLPPDRSDIVPKVIVDDGGYIEAHLCDCVDANSGTGASPSR